MKDIRNYSLLAHNTFGIEARCRRFLEYETVEEAQAVAAILREQQEPYLIIGSGSNLLLTGDFPGTVVHSGIRRKRENEENDENEGNENRFSDEGNVTSLPRPHDLFKKQFSNVALAKYGTMWWPTVWRTTCMAQRICRSSLVRWGRVPYRTSVPTVLR